jgi:hypothetical protein
LLERRDEGEEGNFSNKFNKILFKKLVAKQFKGKILELKCKT